MGWGEPISDSEQALARKAALSTSQRITARADYDRLARALADAVQTFSEDHTTGMEFEMYRALDAFRVAQAKYSQ